MTSLKWIGNCFGTKVLEMTSAKLKLFVQASSLFYINAKIYTFTIPTRIFYRGVPAFATDCPCGGWCRGLTTYLQHEWTWRRTTTLFYGCFAWLLTIIYFIFVYHNFMSQIVTYFSTSVLSFHRDVVLTLYYRQTTEVMLLFVGPRSGSYEIPWRSSHCIWVFFYFELVSLFVLCLWYLN